MRPPLAAAAILLSTAPPLAADTYVVKLGDSLAAAPPGGRVVLFFVTERGFRWGRVEPIDGPFWDRPQPIASAAFPGLAPGETLQIDGAAWAFPEPLDALSGTVRVQAVLDRDETERSHRDGPGNLYSDPLRVELAPDRDESVVLALVHRVEAPTLPPGSETLRWVAVPSPLLSEFYGREIVHRAGVVLPRGYAEQADRDRRWPAVYVVPGFGGRYLDALRHARRSPRGETLPAVTVVLDPESPLGHHGFVDSPNHGPRGRALVEELIPHLEETFRLDARPEARIVTGHSSGGWASLWLQLQWPEVFGGCWSSAPDPIDFDAFQASDLYAGGSLYVDGAGRPVPSYRDFDRHGDEIVRMTVREEALMEYAVHPLGGSGQQWDTWEAMFSPRDPVTGLPRPMFDALSGAIDAEVVAHWRRFDIARMVEEDWDRFGPIVTGRIRLACGDRDSYYLDRAVREFKGIVERLAGGTYAPGYVWLVPGRTHVDLHVGTRARFRREMSDYLRQHGY